MAKRSNTTSIPYAAKKKTFWQLLWKQKALCIMALAPLIMLIIFKYVPMYGILIAFQDYTPGSPILAFDGSVKWVGLKHFENWSSEFVIYVSGGNYLCYSAE